MAQWDREQELKEIIRRGTRTKEKNMRTALKNHSEVAHVWAQQKQNEGRASHMFFDGASIYSYGRHFEIARFITPEIVFFTTREYSSSTGNHKSYVRRAISHKMVFDVPSMNNHRENVTHYVYGLVKTDKKIKSSVKHALRYLGELLQFRIELIDYLELFGKHLTPEDRKYARKAIKDATKNDYAKELARSKKWCDLEEARRLERDRKRELADAERIELWKAGDPDIRSVYTVNPILRVKGEFIQTSHGAEVPLNFALELFELIKKGEPVHGFTLGNYTVTGFTDGVLTVGCHKIPLAEMERLAGTLKTIA